MVVVEAENACVYGINNNARAKSIKEIFLSSFKDKLKSYSIPILKDVSFRVRRGEKVGILGLNGSGKSSLLKVISKVYPLSSGNINVTGSLASIIEMGAGLDRESSGRINVRLGLILAGRYSDYNQSYENEIIEFSGLGEKIDIPIKYYSSGMMSRLAFSIAAFQKKDIVILDEVFATGDESFLNKSKELMSSKFKDETTVFLVHHRPQLIKEYCNRAFLMDEGRLLFDSDPVSVGKEYQKIVTKRRGKN